MYDQVHVKGVSVAGMGTCLFLPELYLCIDVAQGLPYSLFLKTEKILKKNFKIYLNQKLQNLESKI